MKQIKCKNILKTTLSAMMLTGIMLVSHGITSAQAEMICFSNASTPAMDFIEQLQKIY